jgi:nitroimidazol reductase NimA-like FMN-containing flavoprotein (pyridoxamine 5'-phosphate oxidase superfamily)
MKESWFPSHLTPIPPDECLELLADEPVGRVAYCNLHGPVVLPVNHMLSDVVIWFRTSPYSELARHLGHAGVEATVAFEVDEFDNYTESGWSVLVEGTATLPAPDERPEPEERPRPWAEGSRDLYVRVRPRSITGRRLLPA